MSNLPFSLRHFSETKFHDEGMDAKWEFDKVSMYSVEETAASCKPVNNILFLKTHKTGSSTLTNILNRYGDKRDLLFALPLKGTYHFYWPRPFRLRYAMAFGREPNILCNHARYNKAPMHWLFPKETTRYITMLREPTVQFESVFNFFRLEKRIKDLRTVKLPMDSFLQNATFYFEEVRMPQLNGSLNLIKNPMLFELGLDTAYHGNLTVVRNYIRFLLQEFDIVMLMEYFDESLVLLKRRFCWKIEDILYFKLNERRQKEKGNVTKHMKEQIRTWNWGDVLLYDAFNQTLWEMIKQEGPDFFEDLALFRKEKQAMEKACLREGTFLTKPYRGRLVQGYAVKADVSKELNATCNKMIMNEIPFIEHHLKKLIKSYEDIDNSVNQPAF